MVVYNKKNKPYIILTKDKLIFLKGIYKKSFNREKIRSIKITQNFKVSVLYGKRIYSIVLDKLRIEEFENVKLIFDELNKEKIVFFSEDNRHKKKIYLVVCGAFWILSFITAFIAVSFEYIIFMMGLGYFIGFLYLSCSLQYSYKLLYKDGSNVFRIYYGINKKIKIPLSDEEYKIKYDRENHKYLLTKNKRKLISFYNGIIYPIYYKDHLSKMIKVKLDIN